MGYDVRGRCRHVSESAKGLAKMMAVIVTLFEAAGLIVSKLETDTMLLRTPSQGL